MARKKKVRDFSNPRKLGFMRWLLIWNVLMILMSILAIGMMTKESMPLNRFENVWGLIAVINNGVMVWLIMGRKEAVRTAALAYAGLTYLYLIVNFFLGFSSTNPSGDVVSLVTNLAFESITPLYFLTSRRVKAIMVQPLDMETRRAEFEQHVSFFQPKTWAFWRNLIMYFCVFSVVGHWMEAGYCLFIKWGLIPGIYDPNSQIWSDWLFPFCVYGVGAVCCVLLFYPVRLFLQAKIKTPVVPLLLSFAWNALVCTGIELAMGLMLNQPVNGVYPLWDYSNMFCNFMGQVCLQNAMAFGLVATLMTWVIYPALENGLGRLPRDFVQGLFIAIVLLFAMLFGLYCIKGFI